MTAPPVHRYLGTTPLGRSQRITRRSHTVGRRDAKAQPNRAVWHGGRELVFFIRRLSEGGAHPLSHSLTSGRTLAQSLAHSHPRSQATVEEKGVGGGPTCQ